MKNLLLPLFGLVAICVFLAGAVGGVLLLLAGAWGALLIMIGICLGGGTFIMGVLLFPAIALQNNEDSLSAGTKKWSRAASVFYEHLIMTVLAALLLIWFSRNTNESLQTPLLLMVLPIVNWPWAMFTANLTKLRGVDKSLSGISNCLVTLGCIVAIATHSFLGLEMSGCIVILGAIALVSYIFTTSQLLADQGLAES